MFIYLSVSLHHHLSVQDGQEAHGRTLKTLCCVREPSGRWPHVVRFHLSEMSRIDKSIGTENNLWLAREDGRIGRW